MLDLIREAPLGQAIRFLSGNRLLQYPEETKEFALPAQYVNLLQPHKEKFYGINDIHPPYRSDIPEENENDDITRPSTSSQLEDSLEELGMVRTANTVRSLPFSNERMRDEMQHYIERVKSIPIIPQKTQDGLLLVDWYTTDDPANPQNWSKMKKFWVVGCICIYTFVVYSAGPVYATAEIGITEYFNVSPIAAALGFSLYICSYGLGDLVFAPLCEIPIVGRNPVYYITFVLFWILSFPSAVVTNFGGLLVLRFLLGFFGSPALANGGATFGDMYSLIYLPFSLSFWVYSAFGGPAFGPVIGGFADQAKGWRWPLWEITWLSSPTVILLLTLVPETSASNILLRRAKRLRKLTGDNRLNSQSEIDQKQMTAGVILTNALIKPLEIMIKDPAVLFVQVYMGFVYGVFYTFFEVFPLVFPTVYEFNLGQTGMFPQPFSEAK
jgi:DHA1 family multidrug resistance protein-like MFS transporter